MIVVSVSQSVMLFNSASLCQNGRMDKDAVWGDHSCGLIEHCVRQGSSSPRTRGTGSWGKLSKFSTHYIPQEQLKLET